jgi:hypothetical protein
MSTDNPQSDVPSLDEDLVAYLDGELEDPASRRLEERLASDESARERLRGLATSWNLLDHLPRAAVDEAFTRTTVELLVAEARKDIAAEQAALPFRKRRRWIAAAVAGLAAAMIGFTAVVVAWPDENERLLRDLPVVQNLELYDVVPREDSLVFLRRLENEELFLANPADEMTSESEPTVSDEGASAEEKLAARRAEVEAMPADKKNQLRKLYERFQQRSEIEQDRLRQLDAALRSDPEEPHLRAVLESYHNWLPTLTPLERAKLLDMTKDDAIVEIQRLKREELRGLARSGKSGQGPLTLSDVDKIELWLEERAWNQKDEILAKATVEQREWFENLPENRKKRLLVHLTRERGPSKAPKLKKEEWDELLTQVPTVHELFANKGKADALLTQFTKDAKDVIRKETVQATTLEAQQQLLFEWYFRAQFARLVAGAGVSGEELQRFLNEELSDDDRKKLSNYPPDRFRKELRLKYFFEKELPPRREPWLDGKWRRGRGDGHDRPGEGHSRFDGERRRKGPPSDGNGHDNNDNRRRERNPAEDRSDK